MGRVTPIIFFILVVFAFSNIYSQVADSNAVAEQPEEEYVPSSPGDVVDLTETAIEIKLEPDRPLVQIMSTRLKPEFDDVNLEKSFIPELLGKGEEITVLEQREPEEIEAIDVDKVVNKKR